MFKQLFANIIHFAAQFMVKALKVVDQAIVYGLSIHYSHKSANIFKMVINFPQAKTILNNFGVFPLTKALNDVACNGGVTNTISVLQ